MSEPRKNIEFVTIPKAEYDALRSINRQAYELEVRLRGAMDDLTRLRALRNQLNQMYAEEAENAETEQKAHR